MGTESLERRDDIGLFIHTPKQGASALFVLNFHPQTTVRLSCLSITKLLFAVILAGCTTASDTSEVSSLTIDDIRACYQGRVEPEGTISETYYLGRPGIALNGVNPERFRWAVSLSKELVWKPHQLNGQALYDALFTIRCVVKGDPGPKVATFRPALTPRSIKYDRIVETLEQAGLPTPGSTIPPDHTHGNVDLQKSHPLMNSLIVRHGKSALADTVFWYGGARNIVFERHYYVAPSAYVDMASVAAEMIAQIKVLAREYSSSDESSKAAIKAKAAIWIADLSYVFANFRPFMPNGNWGIFYIVIHQARELFDELDRYSEGLDLFLILGADTYIEARKIFSAWANGRLALPLEPNQNDPLRYFKGCDSREHF